MGSDGKKKKLGIIIAVSAILLVAIVSSATYVVTRKYGKSSSDSHEGNTQVSTSANNYNKAIKEICKHTDYKDTCESSLASASSSDDPKELIKVGFQAAKTNIAEAVKNISVYKEASKDPMTTQALDICKEVLDNSIEDIQSSIDKVGNSGVSQLGSAMGDLKTWIGGAITFQETCLDAFENTTGNTGEEMKKLLKTSGELTSNGLAMVSSFSDILGKLNIPSTTNSRRLLQHTTDGFPSLSIVFPSFVDAASRKLLLAAADSGNNNILKPNAIVAQDGSGQFRTINEALETVPPKNNLPFIIFVKAGIYNEHVHILKNLTRVVLIGEGPTKTKITGNKNYVDGTPTFHSATVAVDGNYFVAKDIGFENSAGPEKHQAVALRVTGDFAVFFNCQMDGYQDTLYAHNRRQFYRDCSISGTIDFVFGDAQAIFQNCKFIVRKPLPNQACMVTAQGRKDRNGPGALIFQNCHILPAPELHDSKVAVKSYLGRPWKEYSRTIIMNTFIDAFIAPEGWSPWTGNFALDTLYYAEYQNNGPGADNPARVTWKGIQKITPEIAESFSLGNYYVGGDAWIKDAFVPHDTNLVSSRTKVVPIVKGGLAPQT